MLYDKRNIPGNLKWAKLNLFTGITSAIKAFLLNRSSLLICVLSRLFMGGCTDHLQFIPLLCCKRKGISRKVEMSKVQSCYCNKLSSKRCSFELEQFFYLCFVLTVQGAALITSSVYHYCVVKQKEFSRKVEMSKVESFYWNKLSSKSFSFELEQFFNLFFVLVVQGGCTDNIKYILLVCYKTKGIFWESWNEQSWIFSLE